ncbi:hypothetical protein QRD43_20985 [Pelomonas sp. APW6]|uniref:Uncharacterized protein n=1 Tax=Roseateles subflavus TaxID=3053353 RepID=A0ABT7LSG0_9BURK|nr:hypothetical protein [Pelomonas sp. APW6]MDL5034391.1 hypothetical protein [Pelomonas sp. APW6]
MKPIKPLHPVYHRQKGWAMVCTFAFLDGKLPDSLVFRNWLIPYEGSEAEPSGVDMPWGIFGSNALQSGMFIANNFATANKKVMVLLQAWYQTNEATGGALISSMDEARAKGMLNLARIASKFRQELREKLMTIIREYRPEPHLIGLERLDWEQFLAAEPRAVREFLRRSEDLYMIMHPVIQQFDRTRSDTLMIASFKPDPTRIMAAEARYMDQIKVLI